MRGRIWKHLNREEMMAETLIVALFLAFSGGFQDAYTFIVRDHVGRCTGSGFMPLITPGHHS